MSTIQFFRVDTCIVEMIQGGITIGPVHLFEKKHGMRLDLNKVPYISSGNRRTDSLYIQRLMNSDHTLRFEDLPLVYPELPVM
jgi:hypothetical protein